MKISGLEYKTWFARHFPRGFRIEHATLETRRDDEWLIADTDLLDSNRLGALIWDGDPDQDPTGGRGMTVTKAIREARTQDPERFLLVSVPKEQKQTAIELMKQIGGKILNG